MKSLSILVAAASVAVATFDNLPSCGQVCMTNMNNIAINDFGCAQGNIVCYCEKINYGYGIRDCANEACSSPQDAANVISYGSNYCAGESLVPNTNSLPLTQNPQVPCRAPPLRPPALPATASCRLPPAVSPLALAPPPVLPAPVLLELAPALALALALVASAPPSRLLVARPSSRAAPRS
ncbi:hypothetical protein BC567DRAFT_76003 [Phyllosticta citribraziliensis]